MAGRQGERRRKAAASVCPDMANPLCSVTTYRSEIPTASPSLEQPNARHTAPSCALLSSPWKINVLLDEVAFPKAFSQGVFLKVPAHFKAFRANYTKVHVREY